MLRPGVSSSPLAEDTRDRKGVRKRSKSHSRRPRETPAYETNSISTVPLYGQSPLRRPLPGTLAFSPRVVGVQGTGENEMISGTIGPGRHRTTIEEVTSPYNSNSGASPRGVVPSLSPSGVFLPNTDQGTVLYPSTHSLFPVNASSYVDPRGIQVSVMIPFQAPGPVAGSAFIDPQTSNGGERVSEGVQTTSGSRRRKSNSLNAVSLPESSPHASNDLPISHLAFRTHESESAVSHLPHSPAGKDISSPQTARIIPVPSDRSPSPHRRRKRIPRAPSTSHRLANPLAGVSAIERLSERESGPDEKRVSEEGNPAVAPDGGKNTSEESLSVARESAKLRNPTTVQQGRRKKEGGRLERVATQPRQRRGRKAEKLNEVWEERKRESQECRTASQNHWKESETDGEMQTETSPTNSGDIECAGTEEIHFQARSKKNAVAKVIVDIRNDIIAAVAQAYGSQSKRSGRQRGIRAILILFGLLFTMSHVISLHTPDTNLSVWSVSASAVSSVLATSFWLLVSLPWSLFSSDISSLSISGKATEAPNGRAVNWALARKGAIILENETTGLPPRWAAMLSRHLGNVASVFMPTYIAAKGTERWGEPPDHSEPEKTQGSRPFPTEPLSGLMTVNWSHYFPMIDHEIDASVLLQDTKKREGTDEKFFHFEGRQGQVAVHLPKRIAVTSIGIETKPLLRGNEPRASACDPSVPSHVNVFVAVDNHRKIRNTRRRNDRAFIPDMPFEKQKHAENGSDEHPEVQKRTGEEIRAHSGESNDSGAENKQDWFWVEVGSFAIPCSAAGEYTLHTFPVKRVFSLSAQKAQAKQYTKAKQERWEQTDEDAEDDSDSRRHARVETTDTHQCADEGEGRQSGAGKTGRREADCLPEKCVACGLSATECVIADKFKFVLTARDGATCTRLYGLRVLGCDGS